MSAELSPNPRGTEWHRTGSSAVALLRRYALLCLERWWAVVTIVVVTMAGAVGWWAQTPKAYQAESLLLVTDVQDPVYTQFPGLINGGGSLTRDVETVARIVMTPEVGTQAAKLLGSEEPGPAILGGIVATPIGESFLVSVAAKEPTADGATRTADAVAQATIMVLTRRFQTQVDAQVKRLSTELTGLGQNATAADRQVVIAKLAQVRALVGSPNPTVLLQAPATVPSRPTSPGIVIVSGVSLIVGLMLAFGLVVLVDTADQRIRNEGQLVENFTLPTLARIPLGRVSAESLVVDRDRELAAAEAFRTLRQGVVVLRRDPDVPRSLLFTSAAPAEGKTTCAINTAIALVESGYRVLLVDADFRHPNIGQALSVASGSGIVEVLRGETTLSRAIVMPRDYAGRLEVLVFNPLPSSAGEGAFSQAAIEELIASASAREVDFVVFDAPPLGLIADALPIAAVVDDVFVTVMRGRTSMTALRSLASLLSRYGITPRGFVFIGASRRAVAPVEEAMRSASSPSVRD